MSGSFGGCGVSAAAGGAPRSTITTAMSANALQDVVVSTVHTPYNSVSSSRDSPNNRRPRLRLAVHPTDCPPPARAVNLLGDPSVQHADGGDPRAPAGRDRAVG